MARSSLDERTPLLAHPPKASNDNAHASLSRAGAAGQDEHDFDARFRKWKEAVARKFRSKSQRETRPVFLITYFDGLGDAQPVLDAKRASALQQGRHQVTSMPSPEFQEQVDKVKHAISNGVYPKMITTGSSGSYFVRILSDSSQGQASSSSDTRTAPETPQASATTTVAVFKPKDEEPYGNLNPKRQFLRKYFWWAMGRPCLIPNFSYLSEVGASYLDSRLALEMVPRTELVELASPTFHYAFNDRRAYEKEHTPLPNKIGSYQIFLNGYVNASEFLRKHPWPSRSRSKTLLMSDMDDESRAHKVSRKKQKARLRNCGVAVKRALLCRPSWEDVYADDESDALRASRRRGDATNGGASSPSTSDLSQSAQHDGFYWTPKRMEQFRLQLERLVVLDFLMRNTDRGLDNFMIKHDADKDEIKIGAIDNSLSFPIKHPNEIRQYPFGWLWLPSDLIGLPFSDETREHLLPILNDPAWWQHTIEGLRKIFKQDAYFDEAKFERQMSVMRGQGWNLVQSLQSPDEGPLDLCAREKKLIRQEVLEIPAERIEKLDGVRIPLDSNGRVVPFSAPLDSPGLAISSAGRPPFSRMISSGVLETGRRPIGIRTSESYRRALLRAAGTTKSADPEEQLDNEFLPDLVPTVEDTVSTSLPHTSALKDQMQAEEAELATESKRSAGKTGQQRFASVNDVGTFSRRQSNLSSKSAEPSDVILGRTGIEVLEGLDRQRKQKHNRLGFFRRRSSTVSDGSTAAPQHIQRSEGGQRARQTSEDASRAKGGNGRFADLASSVMSDPGGGSASRWPKSKSASRQGEGMIGSLHDLQSQGEVLSEEEEEDDEEDPRRTVRGSATRSSDRSNTRGAIPTIQSVLQASISDAVSSTRHGDKQNGADNSPATSFTPHIPHPTSIGPSEDQPHDTIDATTSGPSKSSSSSNTRTIKVIVEKISSDTKQAWLKWI